LARAALRREFQGEIAELGDKTRTGFATMAAGMERITGLLTAQKDQG
jgi:hypothetical protein